MNFDITIGSFRLTMLDSVEVTRSVENLADTAVITLPGNLYMLSQILQVSMEELLVTENIVINREYEY